MQLDLFISEHKVDYLEELFQAYFDCRKNKRNTINALKFEQHFEEEIFRLHEEIISGRYEPKRSIAFIVNQPVQREIFAADFRDRVVHHFIIGKLNGLFEHQFIHDSYACRVGKGTHYGIRRIDEFIKKCSGAYTRDCYILKLDIQGFFLNINKDFIPVPIISKAAAKRIRTPLTLIAAKMDILFPGEKMIRRTSKIFSSIKRTVLLERSKHVQNKADNMKIEEIIINEQYASEIIAPLKMLHLIF